MAESMVGFLEKPAILFTMFFDLGITTLSNISTKLYFSVWGGNRAQHKEAYPMSSAPPPPPMALPVAVTVMAATMTATATTVAAAVTVTAVDTNNKQQTTIN